jgi:hypothetical protein
MPRHPYRERGYSFGQAMLTLRKRLRLTQAGLADLLGVSRHALLAWALAIPGANRFSGGLLLPLLFQELSMQKNEPHPLSPYLPSAPSKGSRPIRLLKKRACAASIKHAAGVPHRIPHAA